LPSSPQLALPDAAGIWAKVTGAPPDTLTLRKWRAESTKPIHWLSGEKKGNGAPADSVPAKGVAPD